MGADEEQQWLGSSDGELDVDAPCLDQARVPSSSSSSRRAARRETRGGLVAAATDEAPAHEVSPWFLVFYAVCLLVVIGHSALKDLLHPVGECDPRQISKHLHCVGGHHRDFAAALAEVGAKKEHPFYVARDAAMESSSSAVAGASSPERADARRS
eukprot:gene3240-2098_t